MEEAEARRRVATAPVARLATVTDGGRPHVVPKSTLALRRLANLRANPAVSVLVDHYAEDWSELWWIRLDGEGRVVEAGPERDVAIERLTAKYPQYRTAPPPGPVVSVDVEAWRSWP
jgi:PPOX class probable F420-dependent enzyme